MPGANTDVSVARLDTRGMRRPRHVGYIKNQPGQQLNPFLAAPLRPGETLSSVSIRGDSVSRSIMNRQQSPLTYAELGLWIIPLSALDPFFLDIVVGSGEDVAEHGGDIGGSSVEVAPNPVADHGHLTPGLHAAARGWAGEIGGASGGNRVAGSEYAPYVSYGTYKVASDWYDLRSNNRFSDSNLLDSPPLLDRWIRGATATNFDTGLTFVDPDAPGGGEGDLGFLIEQLFLLAQPEMTYAEYLAAHGVNPRRDIGGLSHPIVLKQQMLRHEESDAIFGFGEVVAGVSQTGVGATANINASGTAAWSLFNDRASYSSIQTTWDVDLQRNIRIKEPSILLGTMANYAIVASEAEYAHMFDMTRMTHPGHWGNAGIGGIEEEDFLTRQLLYSKDGTALRAGDDADQSGDAIFNLLNLYLHGDFVATGTDANSEFRYREPSGAELPSGSQGLNHKMSVQLNVKTDLVG